MTSRKSKPCNIFDLKTLMMKHELLSINLKFLYLALTLYFNGKCKPHFFGSRQSLWQQILVP